jgi:hypothetical protein
VVLSLAPALQPPRSRCLRQTRVGKKQEQRKDNPYYPTSNSQTQGLVNIKPRIKSGLAPISERECLSAVGAYYSKDASGARGQEMYLEALQLARCVP